MFLLNKYNNGVVVSSDKIGRKSTRNSLSLSHPLCYLSLVCAHILTITYKCLLLICIYSNVINVRYTLLLQLLNLTSLKILSSNIDSRKLRQSKDFDYLWTDNNVEIKKNFSWYMFSMSPLFWWDRLFVYNMNISAVRVIIL